MIDSMSEMLGQDLECESLLDCFHGLNDLDCERTTAYRSLQRLQEAGIIDRDKRSFDSGSYYHVFSPTDPDEIADDMQRLLNDWYAMVGQLIAEFREKYDETETDSNRARPPDPE